MAVEGAPLSGDRASFLAKERQKSQALHVEKISQLKEKGSSVGGLAVMQTKFSSATATTASKGLNSIEQEEEEKAIEAEAPGNGKKKDKKRAMKTLSFAEEEGEGEDGGESEEMTIALMKKKKLKKNPDVETSFLPDREREEDMEEAKEKLRLEWQETQKVVREEMLEVIYSYWDGTGHRRSIKLKKGTTIGEFLELVRQQLSKEFKEARTSSSDEYMYVKEDLIIPHSYSFYDLIIRKARGKSGPLFQFDVHEDIRLMGDATVEKDESHPGKVVSRRWYDRNKHIFPASRWEVFDIEAKRSEKYSIK
jgi:protein FAM50